MTHVEIGIQTRVMYLIEWKWDDRKRNKSRVTSIFFCLTSGVPGSSNKYSDSAFGGENHSWLVMSTRHLSGDIEYTEWKEAKGGDGLWMEGTWRKPNGPDGVPGQG